MTVERLRVLMTQIINEKGYIVVGSNTKYEIGHIIRTLVGDVGVEVPFVVISEATREEAEDNWVLFKEEAAFMRHRYYYKMVTD